MPQAKEPKISNELVPVVDTTTVSAPRRRLCRFYQVACSGGEQFPICTNSHLIQEGYAWLLRPDCETCVLGSQ